VISRYQQYYPESISLEWPKHYATWFVNVQGKASEGQNIFMFFPEVLDLSSGKVEDYFGFEFIDVWTSVFDEIGHRCGYWKVGCRNRCTSIGKKQLVVDRYA